MADIKEGSLPPNPGGAREYVADLVGFFIPSVLHPIFGDLVRPLVKNFVGNACEWREIKISLPFFLINYLPIINNIRAPSRSSIMLMLSLAILASYSLRFILRKIKVLWKKKILFIGLISFEYLAIPFPLFKTQYPMIYEKIKQEKTMA